MTRNPSLSDQELIVLGGGCAGFSLVEQRPDMPLLVVEPRTAYQQDRTWCGWRLAPHFFQDCAVAEWNE